MMSIMDHTYNIRFLREQDLKEIVSFSDGLGNNTVSLEKLNRAVGTNNDCCSILSINKGAGSPEKIIGVYLAVAEKDAVHFLAEGLDPEYQDSGLGSMLKERSLSKIKRLGIEF